jgi:hypothetical protein
MAAASFEGSFILVPSGRDRSVGWIFGPALVPRGCGNGRNSDLTVSSVEWSMLWLAHISFILDGLSPSRFHRRNPIPVVVGNHAVVSGCPAAIG